MTSLNGFTVTCPSNSNLNSHPGNVGSNYAVKLCKPLSFHGETLNEDAQWQVAMLSVHYTHNFFNFQEACMLRTIVDLPHLSEIYRTEKANKGCTLVSLSEPHMAVMDETDRGLCNALLAHNRDREFLFGKIEIAPRQITSASSMWLEMVSQFNKVFEPRYNLRLHVELRKSGMIAFALSNGKPVTFYTNSTYIGKVLGLPSTEQSITVSRSEPERRVTIHKLSSSGTQTPKLDSVQALYIYSDIIAHQHVGDIMAPLLAYVDVEKSPGERVGHICNPPTYLTVSKSLIDTIAIRICDEHGNSVNFPDDVENVVVRLHFRKCKQSGLF